MNSASQKAFQIMNHYLNGDIKKDYKQSSAVTIFRMHYMCDPTHSYSVQLYDLREIRIILHSDVIPDDDSEKTAWLHFEKIAGDGSAKDAKAYMKQDHRNDMVRDARIKKHVLPKLHDDLDLVIWDSHAHSYKLFTEQNLYWLKDQLADFLFNDTSEISRINWILHHKTITDREFSRKTGVSQPQISRTRTGKSKTGNMSIHNGALIDQYYHDFITKNLLHENPHPTF